LNIPPQLSYGFGALLIVLGGLRAYFWGWKRRPAPPAADDVQESVRRPDDEHKRHLRYGVIWVLLGLFLLVSTTITGLRAGH
jgi:hypothetical protein